MPTKSKHFPTFTQSIQIVLTMGYPSEILGSIICFDPINMIDDVLVICVFDKRFCNQPMQ